MGNENNDIFSELYKIDNCIDSFLETNDINRPIIMFGAGFALEKILLKLENKRFNIVAICDNDKSKYNTYYKGRYEIISLYESLEKYKDALYIISTPVYFEEIKRELNKFIPKERICEIDFECAHYFSGKEFKNFFMGNIARFKKIYELLYDDVSKKTLFNVLKAHFSGKREDFFKALSENNDWYLFKSLLKPNKDSVYLDCGAYDGDTILLFNKIAENEYNSIIALEPDVSIKSKLLERIEENKVENVKIIQKAAFNFNGILQFTQSGVYSAVIDSNKSITKKDEYIEIEAGTIDSILNNQFVDIIKMDIEGAEYKALLGAEKTIKKYKPRLAICLYHNMNDFVDIPELIMKMVPEYKLYLRHHSKSCTDTILYAVYKK